ncbi:poly(A) RNA polymerase, mitochondrial-like [Physella acuta]|uniref:poly(A) RNA polymerase, mitochondrial-like n=1 Tax=Physella acuta TaxID=109671 RepID=UPI0027DD5996|nr:poly(A) RNA polymerase, mitochondrial-like [Physella acuta]
MMSGNISYCECCDLTFRNQNEYQMHCQGKKHIACSNLFKNQETAKRTAFVRGFGAVRRDHKNFLLDYFSRFGPVNKVTVFNRSGDFYGHVEFQSLDSLTKCLNTRHHKYERAYLHVKQFVYYLPKSERARQNHLQHERDEKEKKKKLYVQMMLLLKSADHILDQMDKLSEHLTLTNEEEKVRENICLELTNLFSPFFESCSVYMFGSSVNRFGFKECDLDLFLDFENNNVISNVKPQQKNLLPYHNDIKFINVEYWPLTKEYIQSLDALKLVKVVSRILMTKTWLYTEPLTVPSQRCPVIKFDHIKSGISCDMSMNNRKALHNSLLLRLYGSEPRVHKLVSVLRLWAKTHELSGGQGHLLTSYALTLTVLFYLMRKEPSIIPKVCELEACVQGAKKVMVDECFCVEVPKDAVLPPSENTENEVDLLKGFFDFYARCVNWDSDVLRFYDATIIKKTIITEDPSFLACKTGCMALLDPFVITHNVLGNVNEKTRTRFIEEIKRAAEMTSTWSSSNLGSSSEPWGIAALLELNPNSTKDQNDQNKSSKVPNQSSSHALKMDGEQENGDFCIPLQPTLSAISDPALVSAAQANQTTAQKQWCVTAEKLVIDVLQKVFLVEINPLILNKENIDKSAKCEKKINLDAGASIRESDEVDLPTKYKKELNMNENILKIEIDNPDAPLKCEGESNKEQDSPSLKNKRSSDVALEDLNEQEQENPHKRLCEGLSSPDSTTIVHSTLVHTHRTESADPSRDTDTHRTASTDTSHTKTSPEDSFESSAYTCTCKHSMWIGRKKIKTSSRIDSSLKGLKLEEEITRLVLKEMEKISNAANSNPNIVTSSTKPASQSVTFSCQIFHKNIHAELPFILIKIRPLPECISIFKNLYSSFRHILCQLVVSDLVI